MVEFLKHIKVFKRHFKRAELGTTGFLQLGGSFKLPPLIHSGLCKNLEKLHGDLEQITLGIVAWAREPLV